MVAVPPIRGSPGQADLQTSPLDLPVVVLGRGKPGHATGRTSSAGSWEGLSHPQQAGLALLLLRRLREALGKSSPEPAAPSPSPSFWWEWSGEVSHVPQGPVTPEGSEGLVSLASFILSSASRTGSGCPPGALQTLVLVGVDWTGGLSECPGSISRAW